MSAILDPTIATLGWLTLVGLLCASSFGIVILAWRFWPARLSLGRPALEVRFNARDPRSGVQYQDWDITHIYAISRRGKPGWFFGFMNFRERPTPPVR